MAERLNVAAGMENAHEKKLKEQHCGNNEATGLLTMVKCCSDLRTAR